STTFRKNCSVHWSCWSPPGVPHAIHGAPSFIAIDGVSVVRGRLPGRSALARLGLRLNICPRVPRQNPSPGMTGDDWIHPPDGVDDTIFPHRSIASQWVVSWAWA